MNVGQFLEKWGRTMFERPPATAPDPEEPPELAEIRLAILDQVREKSYRAGGRKVFPFDLIRMPHAWFTGFAPYEGDAPRLAFAVLVEHGGYGGRTAAPIAREVMEAAHELGLLP